MLPERLQYIIDRASWGLWFSLVDAPFDDPPARKWMFYAKFPASTLRAVRGGAKVTIAAASYDVEGISVPCVAFTAWDDTDNPPVAIRAHHNSIEQRAFHKALQSLPAPIVFFDDLARPVMRATLTVPAGDRDLLLSEYGQPGQHAGDLELELTEAALDQFTIAIFAGRRGESGPAREIEVVLSDTQDVNTYSVGPDSICDVHDREGSVMEASVFQTLRMVFEHCFQSPYVMRGALKPEWTDILAFAQDDESPLLMFEAKSLQFLDLDRAQSPAFKAKTLTKHITKALGQLSRAVRLLKGGKAVYDFRTGEPISFPSRWSHIHAVAVVPDFYTGIDWPGTVAPFNSASEEGVYFQIIDLATLVGFSVAGPVGLDHMLGERWELVQDPQEACRRIRLIAPATFDGWKPEFSLYKDLLDED